MPTTTQPIIKSSQSVQPPREITFSDIEKDPSLMAKIVEESKSNPLRRAKLIELISGRPLAQAPIATLKEIKKKENQPYYKETYALEIIPLLDEMIATEEDYELPIADVNIGRAKAIKASTLYNRVYQSVGFVCDNLDPDGKYKLLRGKIEIGETNKGVTLFFKELLSGPIVWRKKSTSIPFNEVVEYVTEFGEHAEDGNAFTIPSDDEKQELPLDLSLDEQEQIKKIIAKWTDFGVIGIVTRSEIKLAKRKA